LPPRGCGAGAAVAPPLLLEALCCVPDPLREDGPGALEDEPSSDESLLFLFWLLEVLLVAATFSIKLRAIFEYMCGLGLFIVIYIFTGCMSLHIPVKYLNVQKKNFPHPPYLLTKILKNKLIPIIENEFSSLMTL
jgi:hypothetical protein